MWSRVLGVNAHRCKGGVIRSMMPPCYSPISSELHLPWPTSRKLWILYPFHRRSRQIHWPDSLIYHFTWLSTSSIVMFKSPTVLYLNSWGIGAPLMFWWRQVCPNLDYVTACFISLLLLLDLRLVLLMEIEPLFSRSSCLTHSVGILERDRMLLSGYIFWRQRRWFWRHYIHSSNQDPLLHVGAIARLLDNRRMSLLGY
jgi:hypothetical protein